MMLRTIPCSRCGVPVRSRKPQASCMACEQCPRCGVTVTGRGTRTWCRGCVASASALRDTGATWRQVSDHLGAGGSGAAFNMVEAFRDRQALAAERARYRALGGA